MITSFLLKYIPPLKKRVLFIIVLIVIDMFALLYQPYLIKNIVDSISAGKLSADSLRINLSLYFSLIVTHILCGSGRDYLLAYLRNKIRLKVRNDLYYKMISTKDKLNIGQSITTVLNDVDSVINFITGALVIVLTDSLFLVISLTILFNMNPKLAFLSCCFFPIYYIIYALTKKKSYQLSMNLKKQAGNVSDTLQSGLRTRRLAQLHNRKKKHLLIFYRELKKFMKLELQLSLFQNILNYGRYAISASAPFIILYAGGLLLIHQEISIGQLVAVFSYLYIIFKPLSRLTQVNINFQSTLASLTRINSYPDSSADPSKKFAMKKWNNYISFHNVSYENESSLIIKNLSYTIPKGHFVGIVGENGSGKSTLLRMLLGEVKCSTGYITYDGIPVDEIETTTLYRDIAVVPQEINLIEGSIYENIAYGCPGAPPSTVFEAAKLVGLEEIIQRLPEGYDTWVNENSLELSQGQKQRISIARALLKKASILILDEPSSSLDPESELIINSLLKQLKDAQCTIILVTHRFSPLLSADAILVLERGRLVEEGTHHTLISQNGVYRKLFMHQSEPSGFMNENEKYSLLGEKL
ncbi:MULTISPECIES: ABC transporter ATP-binding protein [Paenibacillus]|uniref:ABC transporter ATP-binding protein n=1 Tax=Paenibacillus TaxID=44249 RepID=UPI0022B93966|nr:ABC transporter ATP-binding protein [Paenibacillus caseinilyticus]MCZ8521075.1 ABC transporter ATP-binding protein [Paenibacillus caseinilyticus]